MAQAYFPHVDAPDHSVFTAAAAVAVSDEAGSVAAAHGKLDALGSWISACQNQYPPKALKYRQLVLFAGDHGIAPLLTSAQCSPTADQLKNLQSGHSAAARAAAQAEVSAVFVDVSLDRDASADSRVRRSSGRIDRESAMTAEEWGQALAVGKKYADAVADNGADIVAVGNLGAGIQTVAAAVIGSLTTTEPARLACRELPVDAWKIETEIIRDAMFRARDHRRDPVTVTQLIGSPDLVATIGFLGQCAVRRTPVIIDGVAGAAAALCADKLAPGAREWWIAGQLGTRPAQHIALDALEMAPLLALGMNSEAACGAALAMPLVALAVDIMAPAAT